MGRLFIHIGTEKTGTTTIQKFLALNKKLLRTNNYHIPHTYDNMNHRYITSLCQKNIDDFYHYNNIFDIDKKEIFKKNLKKKFLDEFKNLDSSLDVVISSEHLHSRYNNVKEVECLYNLFKDYFDEINIIVYLRNQVDLLQSYYSTVLKADRYFSSITNFINNEFKINFHYYDFSYKLSLWEKIFGEENIKVRLFDKNEFIDKNLINDFLYTISPSLYESIKDKYTVPISLNESIDNNGEKLFKILNQNLLRIIDKDGINKTSIKIRSHISKNCKGKLKLIDNDVAKNIMKEFKESNNKVKNKYFPKREKLFNINYKEYQKEELNISQCVLDSFEDLVKEIKIIENKEKQLFSKIEYKKVILLDGWYNKEKQLVWARGNKTAKLLIMLPKNFYELLTAVNVHIKIRKIGKLKIKMRYNNNEKNIDKNILLNISRKELEENGGLIFIEFTHENAESPKGLGINSDIRILGIGIEDISFKEII